MTTNWKRRESPPARWRCGNLMLYALASTLMLLMQAAASVGPTTTSPGVDQLGDAYLTPSWDLEFGEGENVEVSCGVFTGGHPDNVTIHWKNPKGVLAHSTVSNGSTKGLTETGSMYAVRRDKNYENDTQPGAFSVLTLYLRNLTLLDTGVYLCEYNITGPNTTTSISKSIMVAVRSSRNVCGFESEELCGWTQDSTADIMWIHHDGAHEGSMDRGRALRYDHTYGPGKHTGHVLDVDIQRDGINTTSMARLVSQVYFLHDTYKCFEFWHICHGKNYVHLKVLIQPQISSGNKTGNESVIFSMDGDMNTTNGEWRLGRATIPPQKNSYKIIIEGVTCTGRCQKGTLAIDDIHIHTDSCQDSEHTWPDIGLQLRLVNGSESNEGRVEVLHDGQWGTICSANFGDNDARQICQALGYETDRVTARRSAHFGSAPENYIIWLTKVGCQGQEDDLGSCLSKGEAWGETGCTHDMDAAVLCQDPKVLPTGHLPITPTLPTSNSTTAAAASTATTTTAATAVSPSTATSMSSTSTLSVTTATYPTTTTLAHTPTDETSMVSLPQTTTTVSTEKTKPGMTTALVRNTTTEEKEILVNQTDYETVTIEATMMSPRKKTGAAVGISIILIMLIMTISIYVYRKRKYHKKSKYIVFSNPKYQREHLPSNDMISLDSPLTSGHSILA